MRILTLGDSWTYGSNECNLNPEIISWPAQLSRKYGVEVVNLARGGSSNQRAARIGIEELCRDSNYDYVIFPLAPASRTEILKVGKWHQVWPNFSNKNSVTDTVFSEFWHPWNDVQVTMQLAFYFMHSVKSLGIPLYVTGLSFHPSQYKKELNWILNYKNNYDFNSLQMPLGELNIGVKDLDRKLKTLKAMHLSNLKIQPDYFNDVVTDYLFDPMTQKKYGYSYKTFNRHPDNVGYLALADYFANKVGLT
jgi:hypothetical protein